MASKNNKKRKSKPKPLFKYQKEVDTIARHIEPRIIDICSRFAEGAYDEATMLAFWIGIGGDLDEALKKLHRQPKKINW